MDKVFEEVQGFVKGVVAGIQAQGLRDAAKDLYSEDSPFNEPADGGVVADLTTWLLRRADKLEGK